VQNLYSAVRWSDCVEQDICGSIPREVVNNRNTADQQLKVACHTKMSVSVPTVLSAGNYCGSIVLVFCEPNGVDLMKLRQVYRSIFIQTTGHGYNTSLVTCIRVYFIEHMISDNVYLP